MKAIIFDFDGVLVESVDIKTKAFRILFNQYPQHLEEFIAYHEYNGGISRFEKIKYFYRHFLQQEVTQEKLRELVSQYGRLVCDKVVEAPYVDGAKQLLDQLKNNFLMFVVSGTPQEEMLNIVQRRGMNSYFQDVFGSPRIKPVIVKEILEKNKLSAQEVVFIGDSVTDLKAAQANHIRFIARITGGRDFWFDDKDVVKKVHDLKGLFEVINGFKGMMV